MIWHQNYDPLGSWPLSTLVSALPVLTLFFVLIVMKKRVWVAALAGMLMAVVLAGSVFGMPASMIANASLHGFVFGFLRIAWIIIASIFLYNVAVETGQFQVMKESIAALSSDQRLQVVLIAFCFGAFLEGTGGGGAPVAIAGSFLIGLGFPPFQAATVCLLANTAPVAWGAAGNPIRVLAAVTGLPEHALNAMTGRILPAFSFILPIWLVRSMVGGEDARGLAGAARGRAVVCRRCSSTGPTTSRRTWWTSWPPCSRCSSWSASCASGGRRRSVIDVAGGGAPSRSAATRAAVLKGWSPFALASVLIFTAGVPAFEPSAHVRRPQASDARTAQPRDPDAAGRAPPPPKAAIADLNLIALPGTAVFAGAVPRRARSWACRSPARCGFSGARSSSWCPSMLAISFMVGLAYVTKYAGMDTVLGLSLTRTGWIYPFFGTLLGWLGVALTGTDAGSNALFGNLQKVTAEQLGLSPVLMASANSAGGVMGKMIDAQSIVVSASATQQTGREAAIFKAVFRHSIVLASIVGLIVMFYAFVIPWIIPK